MPTLTIYPDADPETSTIDGNVISFADNTIWATLHDDTTANIIDDTSANQACGNIQNGTSENFRVIARSIFAFDTTPIPITATIDSATLTFVSDGNASDTLTPSQSVVVVSKTNVSTGLVAGDFNKTEFGTTSFGSITCATWVSTADGSDVVYALNASGVSFVQDQVAAGTATTFGVRISGDVTDTAPNYVSNQASSRGSSYQADQTGTDKDPELVIVYTLAGAAFIPKMMTY